MTKQIAVASALHAHNAIGIAPSPIVIVASGGDNMLGWTNANNGPFPVRPEVTIYDRQARDFVVASARDADVGIYSGDPDALITTACGGRNNPALGFAHRLAIETGRPVHIVYNATAARRLSFWIGDGRNSPDYRALLQDVDDALSLAGVAHVDFFLWQHGEADAQADRTPGAYAAGLRTFLRQLQQERWWTGETRFIGGYPLIAWADKASLAYLTGELDAVVAEDLPQVVYARTDRLWYGGKDSMHFSGRSAYGLGYSRYWDALALRPSDDFHDDGTGEPPDVYGGLNDRRPVAAGSQVGPVFTRDVFTMDVGARAHRLYVLAPSIAKTGARLWSGFTANVTQADEGDGDFGILKLSDDDGETWTEAGHVVMADPASHCAEPNVWTAPDGALWVFIMTSANRKAVFDGTAGVWASVCRNPRDRQPVFSPTFRLTQYGWCQKPFPMGDKWYLTVDYWRDPASKPFFPAESGKWLYEFDYVNGKARRVTLVPEGGPVSFDEQNIWTTPDGRWRSCHRTKKGQYLSESRDRGASWTKPRPWAALGVNCDSRARAGITGAGRLGVLYNNARNRTRFTFAISQDGGDTFAHSQAMTADPDSGKSYGDWIADGDRLYAVSDEGLPGRGTSRRITLYRMRESDVLSGATAPRQTLIETP